MTGRNRGVQQRCGAALVFVVLASSLAHAEKKTVLVSAGDCSDPTLITAARDLRDATGKLLGPQLVDGEVVLDIVRARPTRSLAEIERQLDSARTLFYGGQGDRALELVSRALEELERASPENKPWATTTTALVLKALIARGADKPKDASDAFRLIARIDPGFKLDPDAYPPSVVSAFEATKKEVARTRKTLVLLRAESGEAMVFIDGRPMGPSPLKVELIPGSYRVSLMQGSAISFPHRLEVPRDLKLNVDLAFEGSVSAQPPLCLSSPRDEGAVKLAQLVAAERVIVVRNLARRGEPPFLSGSVFDLATGQKERDGSVQPDLLSSLATFLVTGREVTGVQTNGSKAPVRDVPSTSPVESKPPEPVAAPVLLEPQPVEAAPAAVATPRASPGARVTSFVLIGVGAASLVAGVITFASVGDVRSRYLGLTQMGQLPAAGTSARDEALTLGRQLDGNAVASFSLMGLGVGAAVAGFVGLALFPDAPVQVNAAVAPGQGALFVHGSF